MPIPSWSFGDHPADPVLNLLPSQIAVSLASADQEIDVILHEFELRLVSLEGVHKPIGGGQPDQPVYWLEVASDEPDEEVMRRLVGSGATVFAAPIYVPPGGPLSEAVAPLRHDIVIRPRDGDELHEGAIQHLEAWEDDEFRRLVSPYRRFMIPPRRLANSQDEDRDGWWFLAQVRSALGELAYIQPNWFKLCPLEGPKEPAPGDPWNLKAIKLPKKVTMPTGARAKVAVIDTGFDVDHPELTGRWTDSTEHVCFYLEGKTSGRRAGAGLSPTELQLPPTPKNVSAGCGHGTAVAGVIAQILTSLEEAGLPTDAVTVLPIRLHAASLHEFALAIAYVAKEIGDVDVINLSISTTDTGQFSPVREEIRKAASKAVICAAAGTNDAFHENSHIVFPANMDEVIAVGAAYSAENVYIKSSAERWASAYAIELDVLAPGFRLPVTDISSVGGYNVGGTLQQRKLDWMGAQYAGDEVGPADGMRFFGFSGTSGATPHVACLAALLAAQRPTATPSEIRERIERTCDKDVKPKPGHPWIDDDKGRHPHGLWSRSTGYGLIDYSKALKL